MPEEQLSFKTCGGLLLADTMTSEVNDMWKLVSWDLRGNVRGKYNS